MHGSTKPVLALIAAIIILTPAVGWCSYYEGFNDPDLGANGWTSWTGTEFASATWSANQSRSGSGIVANFQWNRAQWNGSYYVPFRDEMALNFETNRTITSYFRANGLNTGGGDLFFYLGNSVTGQYYYFDSAATISGAWQSMTLELTAQQNDWVWMGVGAEPDDGFAGANLLTDATEFGWALVGVTVKPPPGAPEPRGTLYMDDFSATPTPATAVLFPIALGAVLWARRKRRLQELLDDSRDATPTPRM